METANIVYETILIAASVIAAFVSMMAWRRRHSQHAVPFLVLITCISYWALMQAFMFIEKSLSLKMIFANLRYFAIVVVPIAFFAMAYEYKNKDKVLSLRKWLIMLVFPFIHLCMLWTNPFHHLFYRDVKLINGQLALTAGPFFWIGYVYHQSFVIYGTILFIRSYLQSVSIYRRQTGTIALAAFIPNVANLAYNLKLLPLKQHDITPITFFISGILFFYLLFYYKLFDIVPVARESLIESMDDLVIVLDDRKRILDLNVKAVEMALNEGSPERHKDFIGMNIKDVFGHWMELTSIFRGNSEEAGREKRITYHFKGTTKYYHINRKDMIDKRGTKKGELIVLRDVTALEEALNEARNARNAAESASRAKGYFLANMSHEIRTPMNAIIGMADILYSSELDAGTQKKYLRMISESAQSLLAIINDVLDLSKIEAGKMVLENVSIDFKQFIKDVVESFILSSSKPELVISYSIAKDIPDHLMGDPIRLRQLLTNLIGNAVKFTEKGSVTVNISELSRSNKGITLQISVADTGIGIPKDKIGKLFESFNQLDGSTTRKYGGTGLGLTIVKNIVELMKGTIHVESEPGKGSNFICTIPFEFPTPPIFHMDENNPAQHVHNPEKFSNLRILVAEDNKMNQEVIKAYLAKTGCSYEFADNGSIALQMLDENKFDLVFMDVQMPVMDGLETTIRIREKEKVTGGHIPVIGLTAGAMVCDIEKCLKAGMDKHLSKPLKAAKLYEVLEEYV